MVTHNKSFGVVGVLIDSQDKDVSFREFTKVLYNKKIAFKLFDLLEISQNSKGLLDRTIWEGISRILIAISSNNRLSLGYIQALLEMLNLPYTGCDMPSVVLSGNRIKSKKLWQAYGIATVPFVKSRSESDWEEIISLFGFPLAIKSIYTQDTRVFKAFSMEQLISSCAKFDSLDEIIIEPWITGEEYAIYIIDQQALLPLSINLNMPIKDQYTPSLSNCDVNNMQKLALSAYLSLGCLGFAEIRIIRDLNNDFWVNLVNAIPIYSVDSTFAMAATNSGISFDGLIEKILLTSFTNKVIKLKDRPIVI